MRKEEFLRALREALSGLPREDVEERIGFYREIIDDRMEEGLTEEEAVAAVGSVSDIVLQVVEEYPFTDLIKVCIRPKRRLSGGVLALLFLGSPIWLSLLIATVAVVFSLWAALWAVVLSLWAVFAALVGSAVGGAAGGVVLLCCGEVPSGLVLISAALVCGGLSIFAFFGCKAVTRGAARLTKKMVLGIKKACMRKGEAQ